MQLQVKLTNKSDCYINLPRQFQQNLNTSFSQGNLCNLVELIHTKYYYFGYMGGISQDNTVEMNIVLAHSNGIKEDDYVTVKQLPNCQQVQKVSIYIQAWADYLIVQHQRSVFERNLLNNIQILYKGLSFPVFYQGSQYIICKFKGLEQLDCVAIAPNSEVEILIEENSLPKQNGKNVVLQIIIDKKCCMDSFLRINETQFDMFNVNTLHKVSYQQNYPKFYSKFIEFSDHQQKVKKQDKNLDQSKKPQISNYVQFKRENEVQLNQCCISDLYAKYLKLRHGQLITVSLTECDPTQEIGIRQIKRNQLLQSQLQFIVYSNTEDLKQLLIDQFIYLLQHQDLVVLNSRIHVINGKCYYLRIVQPGLNNEPNHFVRTLAISYDNHGSQILCQNEKILFTNYLQQNIKVIPFTKEVENEVKLYKYKQFLKQPSFEDGLFSQLYNQQITQLEQQLNQGKAMIVHSQNSGEKVLLKWLAVKYQPLVKVNLDSLNQSNNGSLDNVKEYISHLFTSCSNRPNSLIIFYGINAIQNTALIDFQQSQQILISQVLSKYIRKMILSHPNTKVVLLSPSKDYLNQQLKDLFHKQIIELSKPKLEQRKQLIEQQFKDQLFRDKSLEYAEHFENFGYAEFKAIQNREQYLLQSHQKVTQEWIQNQIDILQSEQRQSTNKLPTFKEIGGFSKQKQIVLETLQLPMKYQFLFENTKLKLPKCILLYGMPGCGKSYFAQAICNELKINVLPVKGPELLNKYIGASEQQVRDLFTKAQSLAPCLIFLDEFDSIVPVRTASHSGVTDRVVNQFLCYLDGVEEGMNGVYIVAATSRPDLIDPALLRPGRIDKHIRIDYPTIEEILEIIEIYQGPIEFDGIDKVDIANKLLGLSQADVVSFFKETRIMLSDEVIQLNDFRDVKDNVKFVVNQQNIDRILKNAKASLSEQKRRHYTTLYDEFVSGKKQMKKQKQALQ